MGHWGVHSYENDDASDAMDEGMQAVHGDRYDELMADSNRMSFDDVQKSLANPETLEASLRYLGESLEDIMAVLKGGGHELRRFGGRIAEHDALVASALVLVIPRVDSHRDVSGLGVEMAAEVRSLPVKTFLFVADVLDGGANLFLKLIDQSIRPADLPGQDDPIGRHKGFTRHARVGISPQEGVHDSVRDSVGDLVGVSFRNAFACEDVAGT